MRRLALVLVGIAVEVGAAAPPDVGSRIYAERCSACHGDDGRGDGPAAAALVPRPRNFRDAGFWQGRTTDQLRTVVTKGKLGTMMAPYEDVLTGAEIDAVVAHLRAFDPSAPAPAAVPRTQ
ncbi:MAG: c-type cytochrome [Candidatus Binatia bacterium]